MDDDSLPPASILFLSCCLDAIVASASAVHRSLVTWEGNAHRSSSSSDDDDDDDEEEDCARCGRGHGRGAWPRPLRPRLLFCRRFLPSIAFVSFPWAAKSDR